MSEQSELEPVEADPAPELVEDLEVKDGPRVSAAASLSMPVVGAAAVDHRPARKVPRSRRPDELRRRAGSESISSWDRLGARDMPR
jgi:hypothetical protein